MPCPYGPQGFCLNVDGQECLCEEIRKHTQWRQELEAKADKEVKKKTNSSLAELKRERESLREELDELDEREWEIDHAASKGENIEWAKRSLFEDSYHVHTRLDEIREEIAEKEKSPPSQYSPTQRNHHVRDDDDYYNSDYYRAAMYQADQERKARHHREYHQREYSQHDERCPYNRGY